MKALAKGLVRTRLSLPFLVEVGKKWRGECLESMRKSVARKLG